MAEYGIAMAAMSGFEWLERTTRSIANDPMMLIAVAVGAALLLGYLVKPLR